MAEEPVKYRTGAGWVAHGIRDIVEFSSRYTLIEQEQALREFLDYARTKSHLVDEAAKGELSIPREYERLSPIFSGSKNLIPYRISQKDRNQLADLEQVV